MSEVALAGKISELLLASGDIIQKNFDHFMMKNARISLRKKLTLSFPNRTEISCRVESH